MFHNVFIFRFSLPLLLLTLHTTLAADEFRIINTTLDTFPTIPANTKAVTIQNTQLRHLNLPIKLEGVKSLDLSRNLIKSIAQKTLQSAHLTAINVSFNVITEIEAYAFTVSTRLRQLDLSHNQLRKLQPLSAKPLLELHTLRLDHNRLDTLDDSFFENLFKLEVLSASANNFKSISLRSLYYLQSVDLSQNFLHSVTLANPKMTNLNLSSNNLDVGQIFGLTAARSLLSLDLARNPLGNLSSIKLSNLEELHISNLKIITSSDLIGLPKLKVLDFSNNDFPNIANLSHLPLKLLQVDGNRLTQINFSLPESLTYIGLNGNEFTCEYLQNLLTKLRSAGVRLYFTEKTQTDSHIQGVTCVYSEDIEENIEVCKILESDEDFVYAWHTSLSAALCLLLAVVYMSILWRHRLKIKKIKDQESEEEEEDEEQISLTYHNLLKGDNEGTD